MARCKTVIGKKKETCQKTKYMQGFCRKCYNLYGTKKLSDDVRKLEPKKEPKKVKIITPHIPEDADFQMGEMSPGKSASSVAEELMKYVTNMPPPPKGLRRTASRLRVGFTKKTDIRCISKLAMELVGFMKDDRHFKTMFTSMDKPATCAHGFLIAYPNAQKFLPPLHRDDDLQVYSIFSFSYNISITLHRDADLQVYSIFFLLTPITLDNGSIQIYLGSQTWPRNYRLSSENPAPTYLIGKTHDIVAFDGRLLHRSVYNSTKDTRIAFGFTLFDASKEENRVYRGRNN
jgi:hypothetical protein